MEIVFTTLRFKVRRLVGEVLAGGMHVLAGTVEDARDRVLREPFDLEAGMLLAKLLGDGEVALRMAEPDRR